MNVRRDENVKAKCEIHADNMITHEYMLANYLQVHIAVEVIVVM